MAEIDKFVATYEVNTTQATAGLDKLEKQMQNVEAREQTKLKIEVEVEQAQSKVDELKARLKKLKPEERIPLKIELKQAEKELAQAESKLKKLGTSFDGSKLKDTFKEFTSGASSALGQVNGEMGELVGTVGQLATSFTPVLAALGLLTAGIKAAMDVRERMNQNWQQGQQLGIGTLWTEETRRKFQTQTGGRVSGDQALEQMAKLRENLKEAASTFDPMNQKRRAFQALGIRPDEALRKPMMEMFADVGKRMQKLPLTGGGRRGISAEGIGQFLGMSPDFVRALHQMGGSVGEVTQMTKEQAQQYLSNEEKTKTFNNALAQLKEQFDELKQAVSPELLDDLTKLVKVFTDLATGAKGLVGFLKKDTTPEDRANTMLQNQLEKLSGAQQQAIRMGIRADEKGEVHRGFIARSGSWVAKKLGFTDEEKQKQIDQASKSKEVQDYYKLLDEFTKTGKIGAAEGQAPSGDKLQDAANTSAKVANQNKATVDFQDKSLRDAFNQQGEDNAEMGKSVIDFNRAMNMFIGAVATFANAIDDQQAIAAWAGEIGRAGGLGQVTAGGGAVPPTSARPEGAPAAAAPLGGRGGAGTEVSMPQEVATASGGAGTLGEGQHGQTREMMQARSVANTIAARLGVPLEQVQQGGIAKGDVAWAVRQIEAGIPNYITSMRRQLMSQPWMPQTERSKILTEIRNQQRGLDMMHRYGGSVIERQKNDRGRDITIGERAIVINVNGATNPQAVAEAVYGHLDSQFGQLANDGASLHKR